jgi:hypothetical protein
MRGKQRHEQTEKAALFQWVNYAGGAPRPELGRGDDGETVRQWEALRRT